MGLIAASFGVAAVAAVAVSLIRGRRHPSFRVALMLLLFWALANVTPAWIDPWMDAAGFYVVIDISLRSPKSRWAIAIWASFLAQMIVHLVFGDPESWSRMLCLNVLFAVQLASAAIPGGISALRLIRDYRSRSLSSGSHPVVARTQTEPTSAPPRS